jgi:hypothetical protein
MKFNTQIDIEGKLVTGEVVFLLKEAPPQEHT